MPSQEGTSNSLKEFLVVPSCCQARELFYLCITVFARLVFNNCAVKLFFSLEISENNGFIDSCFIGEITSCCASKSFFCKYLHGGFNDLVSPVWLHKVSTY